MFHKGQEDSSNLTTTFALLSGHHGDDNRGADMMAPVAGGHSSDAIVLEDTVAAEGGQSDDTLVGQVGLLLYLGLVFLVAGTLNLSLLVVFMRKPSLRTISNRLVLEN
jgi:hypothetical protein